MPRASFRRAIADGIKEKIRKGEYGPGDQLPYQHQLAVEYKCSVEPVKRALEDLERDGWVETQQGKGTFVTSNPPISGSSRTSDSGA